MKSGRAGTYVILVVVVAAALFFYTGGEDSIETDTVSISSGEIRGSINLETQIASFKGVPYAAPPVGALRWAPPEQAIPWEGIKTAATHQQKFFDNLRVQSCKKHGQPGSP